MGKRALKAKKVTVRTIRGAPLSETERGDLRAKAAYEGSPLHKRNPGDFGLTPPAAPRDDRTLCDEAGVVDRRVAEGLFARAIDRGLVSEATTPDGFPKQIWVVDEQRRVFEAIYGGSQTGRYHGYPIRRTDPFHQQVLKAWGP